MMDRAKSAIDEVAAISFIIRIEFNQTTAMKCPGVYPSTLQGMTDRC